QQKVKGLREKLHAFPEFPKAYRGICLLHSSNFDPVNLTTMHPNPIKSEAKDLNCNTSKPKPC
ncbi:hypothetical protein, partial [Thiolapillus sp.]|uniref:hypothetical protein n=1 Tax=Thiolapillus sp. TaxID=2017437 RepID=UPI003AF6E13F